MDFRMFFGQLKFQRRCLAVLLTLAAVRVLAQTAPAVDSPAIYRSFFYYHHGLSNWIDSVAVADSALARDHEKTISRRFRIDPSEHIKLASISHSVVEALSNNDAKLKSYLDDVRTKNAEPDKQLVHRVHTQSQYILGNAIRRLQADLSAASWIGLHTYLNEEHRAQLNLVPMVGEQ